jgi:hypothetical protein
MALSRRTEPRCFYALNDRRLRILDLTPASLAVVKERYSCSDCWHLSRQWHQRPEPINLVVHNISTAWVESISDLAVIALDATLVDTLYPFCRNLIFGTVYVDDDISRPTKTRFVTVAAAAQDRIQSDRGRYCRHYRYECCGVFVNTIGWASGAIVQRTLDDRLVYVDQDGMVLVADLLVRELELRKRFPRLWLYRVDVVPEPLDGEVLPGDPGWDGTFRPAPPPEMPPGMPKRGRVTHD